MRVIDRAFRTCPLLVALITPASAFAYSYHSSVSPACHEDITAEALRAVRRDIAVAEALPTSKQDRILIDELPFPVADDMKDVGAAALLLGVRDNDLKGRHALDAKDLPTVHGEPDGQREHCLRRSEHDEPPVGSAPDTMTGSEAALADCRNYIRAMVLHAVDAGLDSRGRPDVTRRTPLLAYFEFSGQRAVNVPLFYLYMGQALHALQDSFSHTFRTVDGLRVTVVLNWVDYVSRDPDERRDGPEHLRALDDCRATDALRRRRLTLATEASTALLRAALDPALGANERIAAVDTVLDTYLSYEPGCSFDNRWCDAPERGLYEGGCACHTTQKPGGFLFMEPTLLLLFIAVQRRRAKRRGASTS